MSFASYKSAYDRDGFVVVRNFLPPEEFADLVAQLDRYIRDVVPTLAETHAFYQDRARPETLKQLQNMNVDPFFAGYVKHPRWQALADALIGEPAVSDAPEWFNKPPGAEHPTPPHQDNYYFCLKPPHVATLWLALDPVGEENGCLRYVAGSHTHGVRPHSATKVLGFSQGIVDYGPEDVAREVKILLQPGDVVAHHGETIHRAEANRTSSQQRRAFALVFKGISCRRDEQAFDRYKQQVHKQHAELGAAAK
jgi:phytanoyl-CoA hydroxylase